MQEQVQLHAYLQGHVQGVGMRFFIQRLAQKLSLNGFVRNMPDGRVEVIAEGDKKNLELLLKKLKKSPRGKVESITCSWSSASANYSSFNIYY